VGGTLGAILTSLFSLFPFPLGSKITYKKKGISYYFHGCLSFVLVKKLSAMLT
jgi:hypothetical protein